VCSELEFVVTHELAHVWIKGTPRRDDTEDLHDGTGTGIVERLPERLADKCVEESCCAVPGTAQQLQPPIIRELR